MLSVDIVVISHIYRQVSLAPLLCGPSRMYCWFDLGAVPLTESSPVDLADVHGVAQLLHSFFPRPCHSYLGYCFTEASLKKSLSFVQDSFT